MSTVASIIPYSRGKAAVVVQRDGVEVIAFATDVGVLSCLAHSAPDCAACMAAQGPGRAFRRDVRHTDAANAADALVSAMGGADRIFCEVLPSSGENGVRAGKVLGCLMGRGLNPEFVPLTHRARSGGGALADARALLAQVTHGGVRPVYVAANGDATTDLAKVDARDLGPIGHVEPVGECHAAPCDCGQEEPPPALARRVAGVDPGTDATPIVRVDLNGDVTFRLKESTQREVAAALEFCDHVDDYIVGVAPAPDEGAPPPERARRVGGVDPGTAHVAVVVGEGDALPLKMIFTKVIPVGRLVELVTPRTFRRRDGSTGTTTHRREVTDEDIENLIAEVLDTLAKYGVVRVAIERATHLQGGPSEFGRVASLLRAAHVGGELAGAIRAWLAGVGSVVTCSSAEARRHACDAAKMPLREERSAKGKRLPRDHRAAARALYQGEVPSGTGDHAVDAAVAALWAAKSPSTPRVPRAAGAPRLYLKRNAQRQAARDAAVAAGCPGCVGHHRVPCPLAVAANARRAAAMVGNKNRSRGNMPQKIDANTVAKS